MDKSNLFLLIVNMMWGWVIVACAAEDILCFIKQSTKITQLENNAGDYNLYR